MNNNYTQLLNNTHPEPSRMPETQHILRDVAMNQQLLPNNNYVRHETPSMNVELVKDNMTNFQGTPINRPQPQQYTQPVQSQVSNTQNQVPQTQSIQQSYQTQPDNQNYSVPQNQQVASNTDYVVDLSDPVPQKQENEYVEKKPKSSVRSRAPETVIVKTPEKKKGFDYTTVVLIFILFVLILYPRTGNMFNKYIPPVCTDASMKGILMRGVLFVVLFLVIKYILSFMGK